MRALQQKIRASVVKHQRIQSYNVGFPAEVFAVATFTRCGGDVGKPSMVAGPVLNIPVDIFMAIEAQLRLRSLAET